MKFQAQLNAYIQQLDCLAKELQRRLRHLRRHPQPVSLRRAAP